MTEQDPRKKPSIPETRSVVTSAAASLVKKHYDAMPPYSRWRLIRAHDAGGANQLETGASIGVDKRVELLLGNTVLSADTQYYGETDGSNKQQHGGSVGYTLNTGPDNADVAVSFLDEGGQVGWMAAIDEDSFDSEDPIVAETQALLVKYFNFEKAHGNRYSFIDVDHTDEDQALRLVRHAEAFLDILRFDILSLHFDSPRRVH